MKNIKLIMLLSIFLAIGCSEEDPQNVAFMTKEFMTAAEGETISVSVQSNCSWSISEQSELISVPQNAGKGDAVINIIIAPNTSYKDLTHIVSIHSEDGTSTDNFTIRQEKSYGVIADNTGLLPCEGGEFSVPVSTNDRISKVETPDWISFVESRSLTDYTYKFKAEQNRTGAVRQATVRLIGAKTDGEIEVKQDSYTPTSVEVDLPHISELAQLPIEREIAIIPEYGDWSKLTINATNGTATITGSHLKIETDTTGYVSLQFLANGTEIMNHIITMVESFDADSLAINIPDTISLGETYHFPIVAMPGYADMSRLSVTSENCFANIYGESISLSSSSEGVCSISIKSSGNEIYRKKIVSIPPTPHSIQIDFPDYLIITGETYTFKAIKSPSATLWDGASYFINGKKTYWDLYNDSISIRPSTPGEYHFLALNSQNPSDTLFSKKIYYVPQGIKINGVDDGQKFGIGKQVTINTNVPKQYYKIDISDESVITHSHDNVYQFVGEGESVITATNLATGETTSINVYGARFFFEVNVSYYRFKDTWKANYSASVYNYKTDLAENYLMYLVNEDQPDNRIVLDSSDKPKDLYKDFSLTFQGNSWESTKDERRKYTIYFECFIEGKKRTHKVNLGDINID